MIKIGFIGTGNMGSAIIKGILKNKFSEETELFAYDLSKEKLDELSNLGVHPCPSENEVCEKAKYVVLCTKPQVLGDVLDKITVKKDNVLISICAGISEEFIRLHTEKKAKVVLVMPNTPMLLGEGASAIATDSLTSKEDFEVAKNIISSCGIAVEIPIDKMKEIIAINGSSPAFIYLFAKGFIDYASSVGIDNNSALQLFAKTLIGSAKMLTDSGMITDELIKQVSSPGGTTIAGLEKLYEGKLTEVVNNACDACTNRAYELGK